MKRILLLLTTLLLLAACGGNAEVTEAETKEAEVVEKVEETEEAKVEDAQIIKVATSSTTNEVMEKIAEVFNKNNEAYQVEVIMFDDAVTPNHALNEGSIDATLHQHTDYMNAFNAENGTNLQRYGDPVFYNLAGWYSTKINSFDELTEGMTAGIANDPTNRAEALINLEKAGVIKLDDSAEIPNVVDIIENPLNIEFIEMERLSVASSLEDLDLGYSNADAINKNNLDPSKALAYHEPVDGTSIVLVVKEEDEWTPLLYEAMHSDEVKDYIRTETNGTKAVYGEKVN